MSRSINDLELPAKERALQLLDEVWRQLGIKLIIIHTLRTWEEQAALWAKGRGAPGPRVTNARPGYSYHNFGLAFDVAIIGKDGKITWTSPHWQLIGEIGKELGLFWGGDFKTLADYGHFEYRQDSLANLRAAYERLLARQGGHKDIVYG